MQIGIVLNRKFTQEQNIVCESDKKPEKPGADTADNARTKRQQAHERKAGLVRFDGYVISLRLSHRQRIA